MAKKITTTRDTSFNYYIDNNTINSISTITATKVNSNIKLLDANDAIIKSGADIIAHAKKNTNLGFQYRNNGNGDFVSELIQINTNINLDENYLIYGSPHKMVLDNKQQYNNCGIDSTLNILVMAGKKTISDQNKTEKSFTKQLWSLGIADDDGELGTFDKADGGTTPVAYKEIFEYYGITNVKAYASEDFSQGIPVDGDGINIDNIAEAIKNGGAAVIGVCADLLWQEKEPEIALDHAIAVTGVVYDQNNDIKGFYIHDTAAWMTRYISITELELITLYEMKEGDNVPGKTTKGIYGTVIYDNIKSYTNNINVTGTNYANNIIGNSGNNTIKGLGGNDVLFGSIGNDKIYGGKGNDIIFGNGAMTYYDLSKDLKTKINSWYLSKDKDDASFIGRNILYGDAGNDYIFGGNYNDTIYGGSGNDYIHGGDGIDLIYGESGNDTIYGDTGDDKIYGQAGDDKIYGGKGDDIIICGAGKDTVFMSNNDGVDKVSSSSGSVTFKFTESSIKDLSFDIDGKDIQILIDNFNGIDYHGFFNTNKNKYQTAYLVDKDNYSYKFSATKSKGKIKVANSKGNNILFSTSNKSNTITTSIYNDVVMMSGGNDTITYTGGQDLYTSETGNNTYNVNTFNNESFLSINDKQGTDSMKINANYNDLTLFFDVGLKDDKKISLNGNDSVYIINGYNKTQEYYRNVISGSATGLIDIDNYWSNGTIEHFSAKTENGNYIELDIGGKSTEQSLCGLCDYIAQQVGQWLTTHTDYTTAFEWINNGDADTIKDLIECYSTTPIDPVS